MLKLRVKTLPFHPSLEQFQIVCGFENSWEFPFCVKYHDLDCLWKWKMQIYAGGLKLLENPKYLKKNPFWTIMYHYYWVKISFLWNISLFEKVSFMEIQKWQYFWKFWIFSNFLAIKSKKGIFLAKKFAFSLKLDPRRAEFGSF